MKNINKYIRVGIDYFKEVVIPMTGEDLKVLKRWNKQTIIDDCGKGAIAEITKYEGFCFIPDHINFQKSIKDLGITAEPFVTHPNGSIISIKETIECPIKTAVSGPSAGVIAAAYIGRQCPSDWYYDF